MLAAHQLRPRSFLQRSKLLCVLAEIGLNAFKDLRTFAGDPVDQFSVCCKHMSWKVHFISRKEHAESLVLINNIIQSPHAVEPSFCGN